LEHFQKEILKLITKLRSVLFENPLFKKYFGNDDRASFRNRRMLYTAISALGARFVTIAISLLSVPLTYNYLDAERFGAMMTIVSLVGTISFADFGIGFGLQNRWAELSLDETGFKIKKAISTVFFFLLSVALFIILVGVLIYTYGDLSAVFKVNAQNLAFAKEINDSTLIFLLLTAISFPFSIVQKIQVGKQEGYITNIWNICANVLSLILLLVFTHLKLGIPYIIIALYGVNNLFIVVNYIYEFYFKNPNLIPAINLFDLSFLKVIIKDGLVFLVNQVGAMVLNTSNNLFLATYHGAATVGLFNIGLKLTSLFLIPLEATAPYFLPALNDAFAKNDINWLKKAFKKYFLANLLYAIFIFVFIFLLGGKLVDIWMTKTHLLNQSLMLALAFFTFNTVFLYFVSYTMLSSRYIFFLVKFYPLSVLIATFLKWKIVPTFSIEGLLYTQSIVLIIFFIIPSITKLKLDKLL
jgi:O-antigen/teichoic acid export membrane protein